MQWNTRKNEKRMRRCVGIGLLLLMLGGGLPSQAEEEMLTSGARKAGQAAGSAVREVGRGTKKIGKEIGHGAKEAGKAVGEAAKEGGREFRRAVKGD